MLLKFLLVIKDSSNDSNKIIWRISSTPFKPNPTSNTQESSKCLRTEVLYNKTTLEFKMWSQRCHSVLYIYLCIHWHMRPWGEFNTTSSREVRYTGPIYCINELMALQQSLFRRIEKTQTSQPPNFIAPLINIRLRFFNVQASYTSFSV